MELTIRRCGTEQLDCICAIQDEAFAALYDERLLRRNSREMLAACLSSPHITVGAFDGSVLAAFGVLYIAGDSDESLARKMGLEGEDILSSANFKLVIVRPAYRGHGLQRTLTARLEQEALALGFRRICTSVSPHNRHSVANFAAMGYIHGARTALYGGLERDIYYKELPCGGDCAVETS